MRNKREIVTDNGCLDRFVARCEQVGSDSLPTSKSGIINVGQLALGKPKEKNGALTRTISDDRSIAAAPTFARARNALLDQALAEIGIDQSSFCPFDGLP